MTSSQQPIRRAPQPKAPEEAPKAPPVPQAPEEEQQEIPDERRTVTGQNPDGERAGAWAASGEVAQRPSAIRRAEEQRVLADPEDSAEQSAP